MDPHIVAILLSFIDNLVALYQLNVLLLLILKMSHACELQLVTVELHYQSRRTLFLLALACLALGGIFSFSTRFSVNTHAHNHVTVTQTILFIAYPNNVHRFSVNMYQCNGASFLRKQTTSPRIHKKRRHINVALMKHGIFDSSGSTNIGTQDTHTHNEHAQFTVQITMGRY